MATHRPRQNPALWLIAFMATGGCTTVDVELFPVEVLAAINGSEIVAYEDDVELDRCVVEDGGCSLSLPDDALASAVVEGESIVSCQIDLAAAAEVSASGAVHIPSGYVPAQPMPYLGWDNPEGSGEPLFSSDPVDLSGGCGDFGGDGLGDVLLLGLDGVVRVEGSELTKEGGGSGWSPPELSPIRLDSSTGTTVWFLAI